MKKLIFFVIVFFCLCTLSYARAPPYHQPDHATISGTILNSSEERYFNVLVEKVYGYYTGNSYNSSESKISPRDIILVEFFNETEDVTTIMKGFLKLLNDIDFKEIKKYQQFTMPAVHTGDQVKAIIVHDSPDFWRSYFYRLECNSDENFINNSCQMLACSYFEKPENHQCVSDSKNMFMAAIVSVFLVSALIVYLMRKPKK